MTESNLPIYSGRKQKSRRLFILAAFLWLLLVTFPTGRANLYMQAVQPGPVFPDALDSERDVAGDRVTDFPPSLPDLADILADNPNDRDLLLAAAVAAKEKDLPDLDLLVEEDRRNTVLLRHQEVEQLDALIARTPRDAALIAIRLTAASQGLRIGRYDSPLFNSNWPGPNLHKPDWAEQPSPPANWSAFVKLANRGAALEPNNTFFDWMRMAGLFALHRDAEALRVLNRSALKTGYDNHRRDEILALLRAYGRARPPTAAEQTQLVDSTYEGRSEHIEVADCVMGAMVEARLAGQDRTALTDATSLFRLCRLFRVKSYDLYDANYANFLERIATRSVVPLFPVLGGLGRPAPGTPKAFAGLAQLSVPADLMSYALALKRPDIAGEVAADKKITRKWSGPVMDLAWDYNPNQKLEDVLATQERWGRILLRTLPPVLLLWGLAALATAWCKFEDESRALPPARGVVAGALILVFLAAGDAAFGWRLRPVPGSNEFPDYPHSATLFTLAPLLVTGSVAGWLVIMSFAGARRWQRRNQSRPSILDQFKAAMGSPDRLAELSLTPLFIAIGLATVWMVLVSAFGYLCANPEVKPGGNAEILYDYSDFLPCLIWVAFLAMAFIGWFRFPDRRRALTLVLLNVRRLAGGYLLAALLAYAVTAILTAPVALRFDAQYRAYLQVGQNATVHRKFGL